MDPNCKIYAPAVLNQLFYLYFKSPDEEQSRMKIFKIIINMIQKYRIDDKTMIKLFIKYQFISNLDQSNLEKLLNLIYDFDQVLDEKEFHFYIISNIQYILSLITKAMIVYFNSTIKNNNNDNNLNDQKSDLNPKDNNNNNDNNNNEDNIFSENIYNTIESIVTKKWINLITEQIFDN